MVNILWRILLIPWTSDIGEEIIAAKTSFHKHADERTSIAGLCALAAFFSSRPTSVM